MTITTQKTHDRLPIVLHKNALAILDKYKDEDFKNEKALPYITNQQMNRCLKDLCEICGFNKPYIDITEDAKRDAIKKKEEMWDAE